MVSIRQTTTFMDVLGRLFSASKLNEQNTNLECIVVSKIKAVGIAVFWTSLSDREKPQKTIITQLK